MIRKIIIFLIKIYQKTFSPDHGFFSGLFPNGYCKYRPTCSEYCRLSFQKYNLPKAFGLCLWRIVRCNPWSHGGHDPLP